MRLNYGSRFLLVFVGIALTLTVLAWAVQFYTLRSINAHILGNLTDNAIYRAETAVDYAILDARDIGKIEAAYCGRVDQMKLQHTVIVSGVLKDIRLRDQELTCWAFQTSEMALGGLIKNAEMVQGTNSLYRLFSLDAPGWTGLGIHWNTGPDKDVVEIINTGFIVFDILPPEIRSHAGIELQLLNGALVSKYATASLNDIPESQRLILEAASDRYPFKVRLVADKAILSTWNSKITPVNVILVLAAIAAASFFMTRGVVRKNGIREELEQALSNGEIIPYYQPVMNLITGEIAGAEILARWKRSNGSIRPPLQFIPFAEESGQIKDITAALIKAAGREIAPFLKEYPHLKLAINVTPDQFLGNDFASNLIADLNRAGLAREAMVIEVTERQQIHDQKRAANICAELASSNIRVAIDDAGTGHNGLSCLHGLGAQYLKIDKYFTDALSLDEKASLLVQMLVSISKEFGMSVVAEGIETQKQADALVQLGVAEGQGYLFAKPMPSGDFLAFARSNIAQKQKMRDRLHVVSA